MSLKEFADALPDYAKDIRLNVGSLLGDQTLTEQRKYGLLLACAHGSGYKPIVEATEAEAAGKLSPEAANAARAAAAVMAMNNIYYRATHLIHNDEYGTMRAGLRMNIMANPGVDKVTFELCSLAVSAINGCGSCLDSHERTLRQHDVSAQGVQSTLKIAAVLHAVAVTAELALTD